jgi:drug/metabolite transporter (DMT)-like permease
MKSPQVSIHSSDSSLDEVFWDPSPQSMIGACILFGCALSSYSYRRQETDSYQTAIFGLAGGCAVALGLALEIAGNLIMMGYVPWALCLAMLVSWLSHSFARKSWRNNGVVLADTKGLCIV